MHNRPAFHAPSNMPSAPTRMLCLDLSQHQDPLDIAINMVKLSMAI